MLMVHWLLIAWGVYLVSLKRGALFGYLHEFSNVPLDPNVCSLPVHYALSNGANDAVISLLLKYKPSCASGFDKRGWTP